MASAQDLWAPRGPLAPGVSAMGRQVKVFQCGAALKWRVFNVLNDDDDDGKHVCDLDFTTGEFDELLRFTNMHDNKKIMTILHSACRSCPALFRLQVKAAAVWRVPICSVQLVSMTKDQRLGVLKRQVDIKTLDVRLEPRTPNYQGFARIHICQKDVDRALLPHWCGLNAFWYPVRSDCLWEDDGNHIFGDRLWDRLWKLSICLERFRKDDLPATVIITVRSWYPDPDTGESVVHETDIQDFETKVAPCNTLELGPFRLEDYMGFDKNYYNNLGFALRIQIVEELRDEGPALIKA
jgi:hypothetical protein